MDTTPPLIVAPPPSFADLIESKKDVLYAQESSENLASIQEAYVQHAVRLVLQKRNKVLKNNEILKKMSTLTSVTASTSNSSSTSLSPPVGIPSMAEDATRDQGFTRPTVLILLPFKSVALSVVQKIIKASARADIQNQQRFLEEYNIETEDDLRKPEDYRLTFSGNTDDCFRMGLSFARKALKLYASFYKADIILASPLGLRMIQSDQKDDYDFLSSIQLLIIDRADVIWMQNWSHLQYICEEKLNCIPKSAHACDFSRLAPEYLVEGGAQSHRQSIVLAKYLTPEMSALFRSFKNEKGSTKLLQKDAMAGYAKKPEETEETFILYSPTSALTASDERFEYFITNMLPTILDLDHVCIYIASYFDYVRLREYFHAQSISHCDLHDYSTGPEVTGARSKFFNGVKKMLLLTERFHYFHRLKLRGIRKLIFYSLPTEPHFYPELLSMMVSQDAKQQPNDKVKRLKTVDPLVATLPLTCSSLYDRFDSLKLSRIFGTRQALRMIKSNK